MPNVTNNEQQLVVLTRALNSNKPKTSYYLSKPLKLLIALFSVMVLYFLLTKPYQEATSSIAEVAQFLFNETNNHLQKHSGLDIDESLQVLSRAIYKFQQELLSEAFKTILAKEKELEIVMSIACLKYVVCDMPKQISQAVKLVLPKKLVDACEILDFVNRLNLSTTRGRLDMHRAVQNVAKGIPSLKPMEEVALAVGLRSANASNENGFRKIMDAFAKYLLAVADKLRRDLGSMYVLDQTHSMVTKLVEELTESGEPLNNYMALNFLRHQKRLNLPENTVRKVDNLYRAIQKTLNTLDSR